MEYRNLEEWATKEGPRIHRWHESGLIRNLTMNGILLESAIGAFYISLLANPEIEGTGQVVAEILGQRTPESQIKEALFVYLSNEHDILPLDSDLNEIIQIVKFGKQ